MLLVCICAVTNEGNPFPGKQQNDMGWLPHGSKHRGSTSYLGFVSTTSAVQKWREHTCLGSGMRNVKNRDIALPSYKIMTLRDEEPPLIRLKVWQDCPRLRALQTVSRSRDAFSTQKELQVRDCQAWGMMRTNNSVPEAKVSFEHLR